MAGALAEDAAASAEVTCLPLVEPAVRALVRKHSKQWVQPTSPAARRHVPAEVKDAQKHWKANDLVNHQLNAPTIPEHILRAQDHLRRALKSAITKDDAIAIETAIRRGAPLYPHYFHGPAGPGASNPYLQKLGMVNPVDLAALELRFRAAMQILEIGEGRLMYTEARPRPAKHDHHRLAAGTKMALNMAAKHGHLGLMRMLLEHGCPVGQKDTEDQSALLIATHAGKVEATSLLLQYGAWQVEEQPDEVLAAAEQKRLLPTFVSLGIGLPSEMGANTTVEADLQSTSPQRQSALPWSPPTSKLNTPSIGARREACFKDGYSNSVMQSRNRGATRVANWCWAPHGSLPTTPTSAAAGGAVSLPMTGTQTLGSAEAGLFHELTSDEVRLRGELTRAIRKGDLLTIQGLLARGAPLEAAFDLGYGSKGNCIDWACVCGKQAMALSLLSLADKKDMGDSLAQTAKAAFFWSVTQGYPEVLEELLRRGADVSQKAPLKTMDTGPGGQTALGAAVFGARTDEISILLKYDAWKYESEAQRAQLWEWATCRKPIAEAFREAGIQSTVDKLQATMSPDKARMESTTPSTRAPTSMALFDSESPRTGS